MSLGLAVGCSSEDPPVRPSGPPAWQIVLENTPGAMLRAHGTSAHDVWLVGADADGAGPLVYHFDGARLRKLDSGIKGDLWWVQADLSSDEVRMVGDGGHVLRYHRGAGTFESRQAPSTDTLFGVWGAAGDDAWYVGGETSANRGVIYRDDGRSIAAPVPAPTETSSATFFKAQGFGPNSVWMVGQRGRALYYDGAELKAHATGTNLPLIAVHGRDAEHVYAVGGVADGVILRRDGDTFINESPPGLPQMNGVWATPDGDVYTVGFNGHVYQKHDGVWAEFEAPPTFQDLHAVWVDDEGGLWAVGGRLAADPPKDGVVVYYGPPLPEGLVP